ncbi:MAG: 50S ribosomal protein L30 [Sulfolobales archaeon]|nr:50S ribosomal protein L30 [Sulfolobales archaeon]MCX8208883.1 50S ribosomal protein L30 [Sulfolobales archaeon]MDW8011355.1 50S ribosomal protein L30 [Sulfolobales archaeon]
MVLYAIVRIRGTADVPHRVEYTLRLLRLVKPFHAAIYPKSPNLDGMLEVVKDWVTWGEISREVLRELITKRGRLVGGKPISEEDVKRIFNVSGIDELVSALYEERVLWHRYHSFVKPVFRLHPPRGGFKKSTKKPYSAGGESGYRGRGINSLLSRLI